MIENACFQTLYVLFPVLRTVSVLRAVMPAPTGKGGAYGKCERPTVIHRFLNPEMKIENRLRKAAAEAVRRFSIRCRPEAFPFGEGVAAVAATDEGET